MHKAHDLIHIFFTRSHRADWVTMEHPNEFSDDSFPPATCSAKRQFPNALFLVFSVCSRQTQWAMAPRCGALYGGNGTAVPEGITYRPFSTNCDRCKFGGAGGRALQRVVTRLKNHGSTPSPPVQREICKLHLLSQKSRMETLLEPGRFQPPTPSRTPSQSPSGSWRGRQQVAVPKR